MNLLDTIVGKETMKELREKEKVVEEEPIERGDQRVPKKPKLVIKKITLIFIAVIAGVLLLDAGVVYHWRTHSVVIKKEQYKTPEEVDALVRFNMEAYDSILQNYWKKVSDEDLAILFQLSLQKAQNSSEVPLLTTKDRAGTAQMLATVLKTATSIDAEKQLAVNTLIIVLYNLAPQGRNGLLSEKQEKEFRQIVSNINPSNDLYQNLGLQKRATLQEVEDTYQNKKAELEKATSTEAQAELEQVTYAHEVLTDSNTKTLYDQAQIEPTVFSHVTGKTFYIYFSQISPTTLQEFGNAIGVVNATPGLNSMIIDFRGNIGGSLVFLQYFLGLFIGQNQYAFDLFHQGDYQVQRTMIAKLAELDRYKEIAILTDNMTQSTAELTTATFKRFNLAHVVGTKTRG
ncbi:MAG: S41 family peptidase [Candidatus Nealsonbacteria bacterium]